MYSILLFIYLFSVVSLLVLLYLAVRLGIIQEVLESKLRTDNLDTTTKTVLIVGTILSVIPIINTLILIYALI